MSLETLKSQLPDYAKDLKLNLGSLAAEETLTPVQRAGAFLASAYAIGQADIVHALESEFASQLSPAELNAAKIASSIMSMNNIYYRFTHLVANEEYAKIPARLRMNAMVNPGANKIDFELWSIAVSAINGCGLCLDSHEKVVRQHGVSAEAVQAAVRIGAVVFAVAATIRAEQAINAETSNNAVDIIKLAA
jgi:lipoyl-dependent peroxiredoxin subunit D